METTEWPTLDELVAKGIALLNERGPVGWWMGVDVDTLDIWFEELCVLGQIYGDYFRGKDELNISFEKGSDYGFDVNTNHARDLNIAGYAMGQKLTSLWITKIREMQEAH